MSSDAENEYFSDGITEEIINALTNIPQLKVIARTSSFAFKGQNIDVRKVGNQLGVNTILEGSIRKANNRVRITAQLVDTVNGVHLWSQNFDRELNDVFALQDEVSLLIAEKIRENFGHLEIEESLVNTTNTNIANYEFYLKGKYYLNQFNAGDIQLAIGLFQEVIEKELGYALAHVNIHYAYNSMAAAGLMPVKEALTIGKSHLDKALAIDNELPECHHSLGWHSLNAEWDFDNATKHLQKAIALRPGYADAHQKLFINLALEGNLELAFEHIQIAYQLDPLAPLNNYFFAYYYYLIEDFEKSNELFERTFEIDSSFLVGYSIYALSLILQGREDYLLEKAETIPAVKGSDVEKLLMQTLAYCSKNEREIGKANIKVLNSQLNGGSRERIRFFLIYAETLLKNYDRVFELIEEGIENRDPLLTLIKVDPLLKELHSHKRFQNALKVIYALSTLNLSQEKSSYNVLLNPQEAEGFLEKLEQAMYQKNLYIQPNLSLKVVAQTIHLHPNKLSWLINEYLGKNYNEYINAFRLEYFQQKAIDPTNSHLTLLGIAYESGFNSKSVFNDFFKKSTGMTPKQWVKKQQK